MYCNNGDLCFICPFGSTYCHIFFNGMDYSNFHKSLEYYDFVKYPYIAGALIAYLLNGLEDILYGDKNK